MSVSKEQFNLDLENTKAEIEAYSDLIRGYSILAQFPENEGVAAREFNWLIVKYQQHKRDCQQFLKQLEVYGKKHYGE